MTPKYQNFDTIESYNDILGIETLHPLVSVVNLNKARQMYHMQHTMSFYSVYLKDEENCELIYGRQKYDFQKGSVVALAPGQVIGIEDNGDLFQPRGWALFFHPDLLRGTELGRHIREYTYFSYKVNEALHLSEGERKIFLASLENIEAELKHCIDHFSKRLIAAHIEILLDHCLRFYNRQFETREHVNSDLMSRFGHLLDHYFDQDVNGLPTVKWCAEQLFLSPNYFGDLVKKETGKTAQEYIQMRVAAEIKNRLDTSTVPVAVIADEMGFQYPQHLTRFFKKETGMTPVEYRKSS